MGGTQKKNIKGENLKKEGRKGKVQEKIQERSCRKRKGKKLEKKVRVRNIRGEKNENS